jgi:hypothetical protein
MDDKGCVDVVLRLPEDVLITLYKLAEYSGVSIEDLVKVILTLRIHKIGGV